MKPSLRFETRFDSFWGHADVVREIGTDVHGWETRLLRGNFKILLAPDEEPLPLLVKKETRLLTVFHSAFKARFCSGEVTDRSLLHGLDSDESRPPLLSLSS